MPLILGTNSIKDTGYNVANSCRFNDDDSPFMSKASTTVTNDKKFTVSAWCKRGNMGGGSGNEFGIFGHRSNSNNGNNNLQFGFYQDHIYCAFVSNNGSDVHINKVSTAHFRDTSAWYHVMLAVDTTQGTASNRNRIYVNGTEITSFSTDTNAPSDRTFLNDACNIDVGRYTNTGGSHFEFDGYLAEVVFIDGLQLTPTSFGEFDEDSPQIWKPIDVSGLTFGNNGFYLDFEDSSNLGNDANGGTDLTESNLTATDQHTDTCTNNFATFNGVLGYNSTIVLAEGNIKGTTGSTHEALYGSIFSSIGVTQGKWYAEFKVTTNSNHSLVGISADMESDADGSDGSAFNFIYLGQGLGYYGSNGKIFHTNSDTQMTYGSALSNNDIVGIAMDVDNQEVYFSINGTFQNSGDPTSGSSKTGGVVNEGARNIFSTGTGTLFFVVADHDRDATCAIEANFGGGSVSTISSGNSDANGFGNFEYSVPSGYFSLCTKNLAEFG